MIRDPQEHSLISSLGWVDGGSLWCFEIDSGQQHKLEIGNAKYLTLHVGTGGMFAAVHHFEGERLEITAHNFTQPEVVLARCIIAGESRHIEGDVNVWKRLPQNYVAYLKQPGWSDFALIQIADAKASLQTFEWYDDKYDKGYQGIIAATGVPGSHLVVVSVQRDSKPVIYDPHTRKKVGEILLAGGHGNPTLYFRRKAPELWADDYDTLMVLEPDSWRTMRKARLQVAASGTAQFIGQFAFDADEQVCAVARPFSGDVLGLNPKTLQISHSVKLGEQPLEVAVLRDLRVFVRDWKSGQLSKGALHRA